MKIILKKIVGTDPETGKPIFESTTYIAPEPIMGRMVRKAYDISESLDENQSSGAELDLCAGYIVELFGNQFSIDDIYDGIEAKELLPILGLFIRIMTGRVTEKVDQLPNA